MKNAQILSSKEIDDWFSSSQVLEAKKIELDIESHFINEARSRVSDSIQHSVEDDRNEKEILCKRKDVLAKELDHLLDLVKQKEMEIDENDTRIKAVDERIAAVVSDFKEIQSSINAKFDDLQSRLSQMHLQSEALSTKRKEIDRFLTEEEERGAKLRELVRVSEDEAKVYQEVVVLRKGLKSSILKSREEKLRLAKTEEELTLDVQMLQQEVSAARGSLQVGFTFQMFHDFLFLSSKNTWKQVDPLYLFIYFVRVLNFCASMSISQKINLGLFYLSNL